MARDCPGPDNKGNQKTVPKKWTAKDLGIHIKGLEAKEKEELVAMQCLRIFEAGICLVSPINIYFKCSNQVGMSQYTT